MRATFIVVASFLLIITATPAEAQLNRSFVSTTGLDTNPCTPSAPCRSFDAALAVTNARGEVVALDSGGFGPFTVTKGVSVVAAPGVHAAITAMNQNGVVITAGPFDTVTLRGLHLSYRGSETTHGIRSQSAFALFIDSCVVDGFYGDGILVEHTGEVYIHDSQIRRNESNRGIRLEPATGLLKATIDRTRIEKNHIGLFVGGGVAAVVSNSQATGHTSAGFRVTGSGVGGSSLTLENCISAHNATGVYSGNGSATMATARLSNVTVTENTTGLQGHMDGAIVSFGNNQISGNGVDGSPTSTVGQQ